MHAVIIGNGVTGVTAALRLRELDEGARITVISGESKHHYSRPALMYIFMGHMTYRDTKPYEDHVWAENRIELVRDWVVGLRPEDRMIDLHQGGEMPYDTLLIATGSKPNRFGWPGQDLGGVQGFYDLIDLHELYENVKTTRHAVIVGGGLIGIELAEMLHSRDIPVTFLVRESSYWNRVLPDEESRMVTRAIQAAGFDLRLGTELEEIVDDGTGRAGAVITGDGDRIECQLVGLTAGVSPRLELARAAGLETGRGVLVDRSLRTSAPHVLAAGDCAEIQSDSGGKNLLQQVWYTGKMQGRIAAEVMAGRDATYDPGIWYNSAKFLDLEYQTYGQVNFDVPGEKNLYYEHDDGQRAIRLVYTDEAVIGVNVMGVPLPSRGVRGVGPRQARHPPRHRSPRGRQLRPRVLRRPRVRGARELPAAHHRGERVVTQSTVIEDRLLTYAYDEEAHGFGEPETPAVAEAHHGPTHALKGALLLVGVGLAALVAQCLGHLGAGTWGGLALSFGLISIGTPLAFWLQWKDTNPGIKHDGNTFHGLKARGLLGWIAGVGMTTFYVLVYWKPAYLDGLIRVVDPLAHAIKGQPANQWFLYGTLYTLAVLLFGVRMLMKYRHNRYQQIRTFSVMFFQLGLAFLLPNLLAMFQKPEFYFSYFWPLKHQYLWPSDWSSLTSSGGLGVFMAFWGAVMTFVATPILTYLFGKRWYCSWVCGCGGLAETLGDPWRQLSDKSTRAWKIERVMIHSVLVLVVVTTALLWINSATEGAVLGSVSHAFGKWYGFFIGAVFAGVVGVGFYPLLGSRVWCRFGCPMAAILGLFQRASSKFRITTNGSQCMSCGNCSTYCEMGIDVRAYAQQGENIVRASCVGCGVCSAACPRGVLKLENGDPDDRFDGADANPLEVLLDSYKQGPVAK